MFCRFLRRSQQPAVHQRQRPPAVRWTPSHLPYTIRFASPARPAPQPPLHPPPPQPLRHPNPVIPKLPARRVPSESEFYHSGNQLHAELRNSIGIFPFLHWDIRDLPSSSKLRKAAGVDATPHFGHSATRPGCNTIRVHYDHPTFSHVLTRLGPITVYPISNANDIKVEDIMDAVYLHFRQPISMYEWRDLTLQEQEYIMAAYRSRIRRSGSLPDERRGVLRVDVLRGCTHFSGLEIIWSLNGSAQIRMKLAPPSS